MNRYATAVAAAALAVAVCAPARAEVLFNDSIELDILVFVPCANGGAGELVSLRGPLHILITSTLNGRRIGGKVHFQPQGVSGYGTASGTRYQGTGVTQSFFNGALSNGQFTASFVNNFRIVGQGRGNNLLVHENFHVTINANGEVSTLHDNFRVDCK